MWTCTRCTNQTEDDELAFCARCGAGRDVEEVAAPARSPQRAQDTANEGGYFAFRNLIVPGIVKVMHVVGMLAFTGVGGYFLWRAYQGQFTDSNLTLIGLGLLIGANVTWRMLCEGIILFFSMHDVLVSIERRLRNRSLLP